MINNKVSFGATFSVDKEGYDSSKRFNAEGLSDEKIAKLSKELNAQTLKNYKMVLTYRDRNREEDSFVLRKKTKDGSWKTVANYTTQPMSKRALSVERLKGIFNILKIKETQTREKEAIKAKYEAMQIRHQEELAEAVKMFDKKA